MPIRELAAEPRLDVGGPGLLVLRGRADEPVENVVRASARSGSGPRTPGRPTGTAASFWRWSPGRSSRTSLYEVVVAGIQPIADEADGWAAAEADDQRGPDDDDHDADEGEKPASSGPAAGVAGWLRRTCRCRRSASTDPTTGRGQAVGRLEGRRRDCVLAGPGSGVCCWSVIATSPPLPPAHQAGHRGLPAAAPGELLHQLRASRVNCLISRLTSVRSVPAPGGDPPPARAVEDRRVAPLARRHRPDDRLDPA